MQIRNKTTQRDCTRKRAKQTKETQAVQRETKQTKRNPEEETQI